MHEQHSLWHTTQSEILHYYQTHTLLPSLATAWCSQLVHFYDNNECTWGESCDTVYVTNLLTSKIQCQSSLPISLIYVSISLQQLMCSLSRKTVETFNCTENQNKILATGSVTHTYIWDFQISEYRFTKFEIHTLNFFIKICDFWNHTWKCPFLHDTWRAVWPWASYSTHNSLPHCSAYNATI